MPLLSCFQAARKSLHSRTGQSFPFMKQTKARNNSSILGKSSRMKGFTDVCPAYVYKCRCVCLNGLQKGHILAVCKSEKNLREFMQAQAFDDGEEAQVSPLSRSMPGLVSELIVPPRDTQLRSVSDSSVQRSERPDRQAASARRGQHSLLLLRCQIECRRCHIAALCSGALGLLLRCAHACSRASTVA